MGLQECFGLLEWDEIVDSSVYEEIDKATAADLAKFVSSFKGLDKKPVKEREEMVIKQREYEEGERWREEEQKRREEREAARVKEK